MRLTLMPVPIVEQFSTDKCQPSQCSGISLGVSTHRYAGSFASIFHTVSLVRTKERGSPDEITFYNT